jgi:hypothetical protein
VEGNGSSTNSTALRDFAKEMIRRGARERLGRGEAVQKRASAGSFAAIVTGQRCKIDCGGSQLSLKEFLTREPQRSAPSIISFKIASKLTFH